VSWLAAARALRGKDDGDYAVAAFAQALHDTLAAQVPSQQASLDASLAATLASVPDGPAKKSGIAAGAHEASVVPAERAGDGLDTAPVDIPWTPPPAPGVFQLTPPVSRPAIRAGQGNAGPFLLKRNDQFDPGPPLRLDSPKYHLSRGFRLAYGESPYSYLMTRRVERAMALLRRGDLVGVPPSIYRRDAARAMAGCRRAWRDR
jgi:hypothetical protein